MGKPRGSSPQTKINVTSKSPVGDISVVTLIRTDTTLDHSQKAEKVWRLIVAKLVVYMKVGHTAVQLARTFAAQHRQCSWLALIEYECDGQA